jgi:NAD(P)-dependent dehydrogenase (short-subunit alcohol dehydrogenase family)
MSDGSSVLPRAREQVARVRNAFYVSYAPLHQEPAYAARKGAIRIFTKVTASQPAKDRIRCNSVHPGPVDTEMFHSAFRDREALERRLQRVPLGRMGTVAEIVTACSISPPTTRPT